MQKVLLKILSIIALFFNTNALALTQQEYKEIFDSFKLINTSDIKLSEIFKVKKDRIELFLEKQEAGKEWQDVQHIIYVNGKSLGPQKVWRGTYRFDQKLFSVACVSKEKRTFLSSIVRSSFKRKRKVYFGALVSQINKEVYGGNQSFNDIPFSESRSYINIQKYNPEKFNLYYNEKKMLERLYETGTCDEEETEKANIQVLIDDKWVAQKESWKK